MQIECMMFVRAASNVHSQVANVPHNAYENVLSAAGPRGMTSSAEVTVTSHRTAAASTSGAHYENI